MLPVRESDSQNKSFDPFATNLTVQDQMEKPKKAKKGKRTDQILDQTAPKKFQSFLTNQMFVSKNINLIIINLHI